MSHNEQQQNEHRWNEAIAKYDNRYGSHFDWTEQMKVDWIRIIESEENMKVMAKKIKQLEEKEECSECEGKCKSNEKEKCYECGIELRIGCANNPSDHSIFNGCCDDCREVEETICEDCEVKNAESFSYYMNRCSDCCYKREMSNREYDKQKAILGR